MQSEVVFPSKLGRLKLSDLVPPNKNEQFGMQYGCVEGSALMNLLVNAIRFSPVLDWYASTSSRR